MPEDPAFFLPQARLANELRAGGLDVFTPMSVAWYNDYLQVRSRGAHCSPRSLVGAGRVCHFNDKSRRALR